MMVLRQATAVDVLIGPFVDLSLGYTSEEGESPAVLLSKNGQALAAKNDSTTPVHDDAGYYNCELDAMDTDAAGALVLIVEATATAREIRHEFQVIEEAIYDGIFAEGATALSTAAAIAAISSNVTTVGSQVEVVQDSLGANVFKGSQF